MPIRQASPQDIPVLNRFLQQILLVHHQVRPDIFKDKRSEEHTSELQSR